MGRAELEVALLEKCWIEKSRGREDERDKIIEYPVKKVNILSLAERLRPSQKKKNPSRQQALSLALTYEYA